MPRLPRESRDQAMGMLMAGMSEAAVARHFGVARSTVNRLRKRHYQTGSTRDRPRPGQPRVTTAAQDRYIRLTHLRKKFQTAVETAAQTVEDLFKWSSWKTYSPANNPPKTPRKRITSVSHMCSTPFEATSSAHSTAMESGSQQQKQRLA